MKDYNVTDEVQEAWDIIAKFLEEHAEVGNSAHSFFTDSCDGVLKLTNSNSETLVESSFELEKKRNRFAR